MANIKTNTSLLASRTLLIAIAFLVFPLLAEAQETAMEQDSLSFTPDSLAELDSLSVAELPRYEDDSLIVAWYIKTRPVINDFVQDTLPQADSLIAGIPDSVFVDRLQSMMSPIPMTYNDQVRRFIELYVVRKRYLVQRMLTLSEYYFPIFETTLESHDMPLELRFLPIIESALNPEALSRAGASGLWQFMYYTGKRYGLNVTSYVDERRDPRKASEAAALFLRDLYNMYGDWHLAIAAYNCGPGNVNRAIARSGGVKNFWKIYYNLPRETRGYVPAFIAAAYAMTYAREHRIYPSEVETPITEVDTVMIYQPLHFKQVQSVLGVPVDVIQKLNPQYKHNIIPATEGKTYTLVLPIEDTFTFAAREDSIYARDRKIYFPDNKIIPISDAKSVAYSGRTPAGKTKLIYTVKSGDVPGSIAQKFGVRLSDLNYWNGIRRNMIRIGQKLVIYVPQNRADRYAGIAKIVK